MKSTKVFFVIAAAGVLCGCAPAQKSSLFAGKTRFTVNFQQNQTLKYKFRSSRTVVVDWGEMPGEQKKESATHTVNESLDLLVSYTPVEVNPYGLTTIKASCEGANVRRTGLASRGMSGGDAADGFAGQTWTFTIGPTGKMEDRSNMLEVIRRVGKGAFRADNKGQGLIKDPDMMFDFIAMQWFLWDSVSSIPRPTAGVKAGEIWKSKVLIPAPMILVTARDVNYQLQEVRQDPNDGRIAVINSAYSFEYPSPSDWPLPYTESYQMSGMFGFLRGYRVTDLQGQGQELFNIDKGRTEKSTQKYTMTVLSTVPLGLAINPKISFDQTFTMEFVPEAKKNQ